MLIVIEYCRAESVRAENAVQRVAYLYSPHLQPSPLAGAGRPPGDDNSVATKDYTLANAVAMSRSSIFLPDRGNADCPAGRISVTTQSRSPS